MRKLDNNTLFKRVSHLLISRLALWLIGKRQSVIRNQHLM